VLRNGRDYSALFDGLRACAMDKSHAAVASAAVNAVGCVAEGLGPEFKPFSKVLTWKNKLNLLSLSLVRSFVHFVHSLFFSFSFAFAFAVAFLVLRFSSIA
jgi:hypothetical protein